MFQVDPLIRPRSWFSSASISLTEWVIVAGDPLPGRMSRQSREAEGRAGDDAEPPECRTEVSQLPPAAASSNMRLQGGGQHVGPETDGNIKTNVSLC